MPLEKSKYIVDSDFVIDNENRIIYYPNGFWKKGYILPEVDSVIKFRKIGYAVQWSYLIIWVVLSIMFYMRMPILITLLLIPLYIGVFYLWRYLKLIKPLKKYEVCDENFRLGSYLKSIVGSINGFLFWTIEVFFLIFVFMGLYALVYKPEKWWAGLILIILSGTIAAFILYVIFLKFRTHTKNRS